MILIIAIILLATVYFLVKKQYSYWEREGIPHLKPNIPFGNLKSVAKKERSFGTAIYDLYLQSTEPFVGIYLFFRPALLVRDAELVKNILVRDFDYFHDRGVYCDEENDKFSGNLFALPGEKWRNLRQSLSPAFTSGKLKSMFTTLLDVGDKLLKHLEPLAEKGEILEFKSVAGRYVGDVLASIAFGIDADGINDPKDEFSRNARELVESTDFWTRLRSVGVFVCPGLLKAMKVSSTPQYMRDFCMKIVTTGIDYRSKNKVERKDLIQYLIQLRDISDSKLDEWRVNGGIQKSLDLEEICAQIFLFYIAGSDTSSSLVAYTLHELTHNPDVMRRAKEEIQEVLKKHNNEITYETIQEMKFLDLCIQETLRKYTGLPILNRVCTKDYKIPGSDYTIKSGTPVIISLMGQHLDEAYFPNPSKYDPDRFAENVQNYNQNAYIPFGDGPRNCIAFRMGRMVGKLAIVLLLSNFNFETQEKRELEYSSSSVGLLPKHGIKIKITKIKK